MMKNRIQKIFMAGLSLFIALALCPVSLEAAQRKVKIAVLPFDISSAGPLSYVGPATEEVLSSRLVSDSISVMDSLEIQRITGKRQGFISPLDARGMAGKLGVDYVVTGKIITEGENVTIDMDLLQADSDSESPLFSLVFSPASLDEIPPKIEGFAIQAANHILNGRKSVAAGPDTNDDQKAHQELSQEETAQAEDLKIARMHPDLLIRQSDKDSGKPDRISMPPVQESYTQKLPVMPPEPLPAPASTLPYPPPETEKEQVAAIIPQKTSTEQLIPTDEPIHSPKQTQQQTSEEHTVSTLLPSEQLVLPQPPVTTTIPQTSSTEQPIPAEQPIPTDGPIWQWY